MRWFRVYDDIIDDPKVLGIPVEIRWYFIGILAVSSRQSARGSLPGLKEIAIHLRVGQGKASRIVDQLVEAGFIDKDPVTQGLTVHGWHARQFKSDDVTARVRTFRETAEKRSEKRCENVPRTRVTETDTETETENPPITPPTGGGDRPDRRAPTKAPFALPDWVPAEDWDAYVEMRAKIRKPLTDRAKRLAVGTLDELRRAGNDPARVLQQSTFNSWQGLFELRGQPAPAKPSEEITYVTCPADSPLREVERKRREKLFALFGGTPEQVGPPAAAQS